MSSHDNTRLSPRRRAYETTALISTYRKLIEVDTKILRDDFELSMPTKPFQPFLRFNWRLAPR